MKQMKQLISTILVLAMLFQLLSLPTWAVTLEDGLLGKIDAAEEVAAAEISDKEAYVLYEVDSLREESEKHFRMSDGTYIAVSYGEAVHYQDADGNWQDIDNTLTQAVTDSASVMALDGESVSRTVFESCNGDQIRQFAAEFQPDCSLFAMSNGVQGLSMSVVLPELDILHPADDSTVVETEPEDTVESATEATLEDSPVLPESGEAEAAPEEPFESDTVSEETTESALTEEPSESVTASEEATEPMLTEEPAESVAASEEATEPALTEEPVESATVSEETVASAPTDTPVENLPTVTETPADTVDEEPIVAAVENPTAMQRTAAPADLSLEEQISPKLLTSSVSYQNVWPDTILRYQPFGRNVKESILVAKPQSSYEYLFRLELAGLRPLQNEDGSISLLDENGKEIYYIPQPYMEDADGAFSDAVRYTLTEDGEGYLLAVTADANWLNDESRAFPVMIDPSVNESNGSATDIITTYVNSGRPSSTSYNNTGYIRCGYYNNPDYDSSCTGTCKGFIYVKALPTLPDGCVVTGSTLRLFKEKHGGSECYPELYTSTLTASYSNIETYLNNLTWNNHMNGLVYGGATTAAERAALDYVKEDAYIAYTQYWDITPAVQSWYSNATDISRLLVMDTGTTLSSNARATYSGYKNTESTHCPTLVVYYRNTVGVEDIYSYHTQSVGRAGTGYVNNFTLGLTMQNTLITSPSEATPFSLSLFYNSPNGKTACTSGSIHTKSYAMNIGQGWKASVQQSVISKTIGSTTYLIYMDADGTEHYFQKSGSVYKDEDGLNLSITSSGSTYTMTDKEKNTWEFYNGYLTKYTDHNGNILFYAYDGASSVSTSTTTWKPSSSGSHKVTSVWRKNSTMSSPVKIAELIYDANNLLTKVKDQTGRETALGYSVQNSQYRLNSVTFPDGAKAYYSYYDGESVLLKRAYDSEAKYGIEYTYTNQLGSKRINHIYEYYTTDGGATVNYGQKMHAFKANATYSRFRYYGADTTANTSDDIVARYAFDNYGRTVNIINMDSDDGKNTDSGEGKVLGVTAGSYMENNGTNATNNRMTSAASSGVQGVNLLYNSGLENANDTSDYRWIHQGGGSMALKASTETTKNVTPRTGKSLLKLYASGGAAERSCAYQQVHMSQGKTYVFSAYVNTYSVSSFGTGGEAYLSIQSVNDYEWARSETINYCTNTAINSGWVRLEVTFTPTYGGTFRPAINLKNTANCSIAVDDLQLEEVIDTTIGDVVCGAASSANLLQMGSFDIKNPSSGQVNKDQVSAWWTYNSSHAVPVTTDKISGFSMTLAGHTQGQRRASQEVKINGTSNTTYLLSGWGKTPASAIGNGTGLEGDNSTYKRFFGMIAKIVYTDTSTPEYHYVSFNDDYSGWQYAVGTIVPERPDKTVATITVTLAYDYCPNRAYIDNVALIEEPVQTYTYNSEGKVTMSAKTKNDSSTYTYDSADRLTGYTAINGVKYALTYSGNSRDPATVTSDNVTTTYTYNSNGSTTKTKVANSSGNRYYQSSATYSSDGNYQLSTMDANGVTANRTYNNKGQLATASTANTGTTYTYNGADRVATVTSKDNAQLSYTYTCGSLSRLARRSSYNSANSYQAYDFTLDPWGRSTAITVRKSANNSTWSQGLELASYTYAPNGGNLTQMTYSNGQSVKYTYDILDRLVKESYYNSGATTPWAENVYIYSAQGDLARQYRKEGGSITEDYTFEYDSLGRLIRSRETNGGNIAQRTEHLYDKANRLSSQQWIVGNTLFSEYYTYNANDGTLTKVNTPGVGSVVNSYDSLKNLYKQQYTTKSNFQYARCYDRAMTDSGQIAPRVRGMAYYNGTDSSGGTIVGYRYGYDGDGNIKTIHNLSGTKLLAQYAYDAQNQLTDEYLYKADGTVDSHYQYSYDTAGNIQYVTIDDSFQIANYEYADSNWGDLLTEYTGKKIAYEGQTYNATANTVTGTAISGNPINWHNGTAYTNLTWQNGRQLASLQKGGNTYTYAYDMNGVRSSKTVNGVKHNYITQNGKVVREEYGTTVLEFVYDTNGAPYALRYSSDSGKSWLTYYYVLNLQGDVVKLIYTDGTVCAEYSYNAWGEIFSATNPSSSTVNIQDINPLRYRGYYYDTETGWYYLQSRYYDPVVKRFISADGYASTGQGILGHNMFAYCDNCPVMASDSAGMRPSWEHTSGGVTQYTDTGTGTAPRKDIASAPDLDVNTAAPGSYNCYGNGIGKQVDTDPTGYTKGDSTRKTFEAVKNDLGRNNVRELSSIDAPIGDDESKVAMKCGPSDYHFIRLDGDKWYNKSGTMPGLYIDQSIVVSDVWYAMWMNNGQAYIGYPGYGHPYYNDETIYFAVKVRWDAQ